MSEITVGTMLYMPKERYAEARLVEVVKVGKKWLHLKNGQKADKATLRIDQNYGSPPTLYRSEDEYQAIVSRQREWGEISDFVYRWKYRVPDDIDLQAVRVALGMPSGTLRKDAE